MIIVKKNKLKLISLFLILLIIVGLGYNFKNYRLANISEKATTVATDNLDLSNTLQQDLKKEIKADFFADYRMERERLRGKQIELLKSIINNDATEEKARTAASLKIVEITTDMEKEIKAENIVKSKGYQDCVIILQPEATTIIVQTPNLTIAEEKELYDIVGKTTGISSEKMSIIVRKLT